MAGRAAAGIGAPWPWWALMAARPPFSRQTKFRKTEVAQS
jgi:hypothetical protein